MTAEEALEIALRTTLAALQRGVPVGQVIGELQDTVAAVSCEVIRNENEETTQ